MMHWKSTFVTLAITALAGQASGQVYEQQFNTDPPSSGGWYSHQNPDAFSPFIHGENFTLNSATSITGVQWHGNSDGFFTPGLGNFSDYVVTIYENAGDVPGAEIYSETFPQAETNPEDTGIDYAPFNADIYKYEVTLSETVDLEADTQYWISVAAVMNDPAGDGWVWAESLPVDNLSATFDNDKDTWEANPDGPDVALALFGEQVCVGDIAGDDNAVNVADLLELLSNWGTDGNGADIAKPNDVVDVNDLLALLGNWGPC